MTEELKKEKPGSEQYVKIMQAIVTVRDLITDGEKLESASKQRKFNYVKLVIETCLKFGGVLLTTGAFLIGLGVEVTGVISTKSVGNLFSSIIRKMM